jgi:hypothetical protein
LTTTPILHTPIVDEGLSTAEKVKESAKRLKEAYEDQDSNATKDCPLKGGADVPAHGGNCTKCGAAGPTKSHSLARTAEAEAEVKKFYDSVVREGRLGSMTLDTLNNVKGKMIGVLLCVEANGETKVLRAFSGSISEVAETDFQGYCPRIPPPDADQLAADKKKLNEQVLPAIGPAEQDLKSKKDAYDAEMNTEPNKTDLRNAKKELSDAHQMPDNPQKEELGDAYKMPDPQKALAIAAGTLRKKGVEERPKDLKDAYDAAVRTFKDLKEQEKVLRKQIDDQGMGKRVLTNFAGESKTVEKACTDPAKLKDGRTGTCAAPKMIARAKAMGLTPVSIAEVWIGKETDTQKDFGKGGPLVPSCECCRSILGFALCGLGTNQKEREAALK